MEIREYAEGLLFGTRLEDKLLRADRIGELSDRRPGPALDRAPESPGRPAKLRFESETVRQRSHRGAPRDLERREIRGALLHQFANHEILAVELMALALLRFPDAPVEFRASLVRSIGEEQRHFLLYRSRMRKLGFDFGDFGVNDFFWKHLGHPGNINRPIDFAVRMGMTFEQANLDYMQHYAAIFARLGDAPTVAVLQTVLKDEIGHVKNGVHWFEQFRAGTPQQSLWDAYRSHLPETLSPVRARGIGFNAEARRRAGLSEEYIEALRLFAYSRGRPPALYWFNPSCEEAAAEFLRVSNQNSPPDNRRREFSKAVRDLELDLEMLLLFLAAHEDALLVRQKPRPEFLSAIQQAGFPVPEIYGLDSQGALSAPEMRTRKLGDLRPWGRGPDSLERLRPLIARVVGRRGAGLAADGESEFLGHAQLYSRSFGLQIERDFARRSDVTELEGELESKANEGAFESFDCSTADEIAAAVASLRERGEVDAAVLKARFGTAGRNRMRIDLAREMDSRIDRWISRNLSMYGGVLVEPWVDRCADFSVQFTIEAADRVVIHGVTRLLNDSAGRFVGNLTGRLFDGLDRELRSRLAGPDGVLPVLHAAARFAGARLAAQGYRGPAGIDAFAWRGKRGLRLRPICEINARYTMGRVALEIARRVRAHRAVLWLSVNRRSVANWTAARAAAPETAGPQKQNSPQAADWKQWSAAVAAAYPLQFSHGLLDSGALFTNDPLRARGRCMLAIIAPNYEECARAFAEYGVSVAP